MANQTKLLTTDQLAERLGVRPATVYSAFSRNGHYLGISPIKLPNRLLRWRESDLLALIEGATPRRREGCP